MTTEKQTLLLQACCAPCTTHPSQILKEEFNVSVYFYNPNIHPKEEYEKRLAEIEQFSRTWDFPLIVGEYDTDRWFSLTKGLEKEREGGKRCAICYELRIEETARYAVENDFQVFTTALSVSPHKNAGLINSLGRAIGERYNIKFLEADFKKKDGFKISCQLSRELGFYRQNYCGCIYSQRI